jgi:enoyl-CoA hydratase/carnithine racemase
MTTTRLEEEGGLAVLTVANPPVNQISEQVVNDLVEVVAALEAADDVRALLVRGEGDISAPVPTSGCSPAAPRRR